MGKVFVLLRPLPPGVSRPAAKPERTLPPSRCALQWTGLRPAHVRVCSRPSRRSGIALAGSSVTNTQSYTGVHRLAFDVCRERAGRMPALPGIRNTPQRSRGFLVSDPNWTRSEGPHPSRSAKLRPAPPSPASGRRAMISRLACEAVSNAAREFARAVCVQNAMRAAADTSWFSWPSRPRSC